MVTERIYLASSWKNRERVRALAAALREAGHEVFDFTNKPDGEIELPPERFPEAFDPDRHVYGDYLAQHPEWRVAVESNRKAVEWSTVVVLMLPCGTDAHADAFYGLGLGGRRLIVCGQPRAGERTPTHLWAETILPSDENVAPYLAKSPSAFEPRVRNLARLAEARVNALTNVARAEAVGQCLNIARHEAGRTPSDVADESPMDHSEYLAGWRRGAREIARRIEELRDQIGAADEQVRRVIDSAEPGHGRDAEYLALLDGLARGESPGVPAAAAALPERTRLALRWAHDTILLHQRTETPLRVRSRSARCAGTIARWYLRRHAPEKRGGAR